MSLVLKGTRTTVTDLVTSLGPLAQDSQDIRTGIALLERAAARTP